MRQWMMIGAAVAALGLAGCEDADEGALEEAPTVTQPGAPTSASGDIDPSAGAAQHPPPEAVELGEPETPDERVAGAAQHPLPGNVGREDEE